MAKMIKYKTCGADIAKSATTCPNCGAKRKKGHPILGTCLVFFAIICFVAAFGSGDEPQKVGDTSSATSSQKQEKVFGVGEKVELNDVVVTLLGVTEHNGSEYLKPNDGNVFVICEFEIENNTDREIAVSSIMSFEAYFDEYAANIDITAMALSEKTQLDGAIAAGKKMKGVVGYQAAADWGSIEMHFTPDFWSAKDIVFSHTK